MHLWDVPIDDELVKNAQAEISEILEKNLNASQLSLKLYDKYLILLREKQRID